MQLGQSAALRKALADATTQVVETRRFNGVPIEVTEGEVKIAYDHLKQFAAGIAAFERQGLPVGFSCLNAAQPATPTPDLWGVVAHCWQQTKSQAAGSWVLKLLGWLLTALAVSLGAPFWFDLLNKLVDIRGAGKRPEPVAQPAH